jgi:hypothetical protein
LPCLSDFYLRIYPTPSSPDPKSIMDIAAANPRQRYLVLYRVVYNPLQGHALLKALIRQTKYSAFMYKKSKIQFSQSMIRERQLSSPTLSPPILSSPCGGAACTTAPSPLSPEPSSPTASPLTAAVEASPGKARLAWQRWINSAGESGHGGGALFDLFHGSVASAWWLGSSICCRPGCEAAAL